MTRIIAGRAGGRRLVVPSAGTRPTSDRVREALFSSLDSDLVASGRSWPDIRVLDLFAGSGALGLEALSRGAASVLLVEVSRPAAKALRANVAAVDLAGATVLVGDARRLLATPCPGGPASLVLVDPPYAWSADDLQGLLRDGTEAGWIAAGADVVVERPARDVDSPLPLEWEMRRRRDYGDTALWYGHVTTSDRRDEEDA